MFGSIRPTPYDVVFSIRGIPVRVLPTFWLGAVLLNWSALREAPELMVLWIICMLCSILLHEMGHALVAQSFGYWPGVFLYHFGGVAVFNPNSNYTWWRSLCVSIAGPAAQLALFAVVFLISKYTDFWMTDYRLAMMIRYLFFINLIWPIFNLVPIYPLDGGQIAEALFRKFTPLNAFRNTRILSIVTSAVGVFLVMKYMPGSFLPVIFFAMFGVQNYQELKGRSPW